jgi:NAD(P)-dependent dehydrogenase (short-subunit alcohol dehydrogenase family)
MDATAHHSVRVFKYELRHMQREGSGAIANNASVGAQTGTPGIGSYIASNHGVVGLTRTAAVEYIRQGIRVIAINPGLIDTQIGRDGVLGKEEAYEKIAKNVPIGRSGRPQEIASHQRCSGFVVLGRVTSWGTPSQWTAE